MYHYCFYFQLIEEFNRMVGEETSSKLLQVFPNLIKKLQELKDFDDLDEINSGMECYFSLYIFFIWETLTILVFIVCWL